MTTFPGSPKMLKGGIILIDPDTSAGQCVISLQCKPGNLTTCTLQVPGAGGGFKLILFKKRR
jgi:hypothetical protein